ncbi:MAG: hypothetical protein HS128_15945 [Ideonella sp.]|nr:hypothetical protein [Ideonella sp.]MCC7458204.1 hypothetical protein [Nitrospira sp.]
MDRLRSFGRRVALLLSVLLVGSCGGGGDAGGGPAVVAVYTSFGSVQCDGGGDTLTQLQQSLIAAGIEVLASRCGLDGVIRPAVCGESDGRIAIFDIAQPELAVALLIGFAMLNTLPGASAVVCQ